MTRVLHYVGRMNRGGMETFIMNLYRNIDRNCVQFDFAVHGEYNGDFEAEILFMGGRFYSFPRMRNNPAAYNKAWREFWRAHKSEYSAFHVHTNSLANLIALKQAAKAGIPVRIVHSHSSFADKGKLQKLNDILHVRNQKHLSRYATNLFACSDKAAEWLFGGMTCDGLSVKLFNNAINLSEYALNEGDRQRLRTEFGFTEDDKVMGHVGNFRPVKNYSFLVDIIAEAHKLDPSVKGLLVGKGPLFEEIKALVKAKGLEKDIVFAGLRSDVNNLLSAMDLFVMPSLYEGLPVSLVEAQANGVPLIVSDTITRNVGFNPNMEYFSLDAGGEAWAKKALDLVNRVGRYNTQEKIAAAGFDIKEVAKGYTEIIGGKNIAENEYSENK